MADDPLDGQLRTRLDRLLEAVPADGGPVEAAPRPRIVARTSVGFTGLTLALVAIVVAVLAFNQRPAAGGPVTGTATDGPFRLTITVPHGSYPSGQAIAGISASLQYTGGAASVSIGHGDPLLGFAVASEDGRHKTEPAIAQVCRLSELSGSAPASASFVKSGGYFPEESDYPWLQAFFSNAALVLDPGRWTITAVASFGEGGCGGPQHEIRASATIQVLTGSMPTAQLPAPTSAPNPTTGIPGQTPSALGLHYDGDGFGFDFPDTWQVLGEHQHVGIHGPTLEVAVGIGHFDLGCTITSTSVSCPADPIWSVPHQGVVLVYRFDAWLGMCAPATPPAGPRDQVALVGGRPALHAVLGNSASWAFPGAPEVIEARWGDGNDAAPAQIEQVIESWAWAASRPGCPTQPSSAPS